LPLSICLVCSSFDIGGAETHVLTLAESLAHAGHRVTVVSSGGAYASRALEKDACFHHVRLPLDKKSFAPVCLFRLLLLDKKHKFDIIHAHARYPALLCALLFRKKLVTTAHWVFSTAFPRRTLSVWGRQCLAVSRDIAAYLCREYGYPKERIRITVNGIDTERFRPLPKKDGAYRIVHCSRIDPDRSAVAFLLLDAAEKLAKQYAFSLTVIGDGADFPRLQERALAVNTACGREIVHLCGTCTAVEEILSDADIFVGVSRAALEAMACGCAVILAGNEGYSSVFFPESAEKEEKSNFCCRGEALPSLSVLCNDLEKLLHTPKDVLHMQGQKNRAYVSQSYASDRMASDALAVYERVLKDKCVLCGYYGFGNVGDSLMHRSLKMRLKKEGYRKILTLSSRRISPSSLYAIRQGYDFFLGGGNLLQDETSTRSLWFYTHLVRTASKHGCRIRLLSSGFGGFSETGAKIAKKSISACEAIECRTAGDLKTAKALGAKNAYLGHDAVLDLPLGISRKNARRVLLAFRAPRTDEERLKISAFILRLAKIYGKEYLFLFAMHPSDAAFTRRLSRTFGISCAGGDADRFIARLKDCRAVYANRLHAGICALKVGIPAFLSEEDEKSRFFAADVKRTADALALPSPVRLFRFDKALSHCEDAKRLSILRIAAEMRSET